MRLLSGVQTHPLNAFDLIATEEMENYAAYASNISSVKKQYHPTDYFEGIKAHALRAWIAAEVDLQTADDAAVVVLEANMAFARYPLWESPLEKVFVQVRDGGKD